MRLYLLKTWQFIVNCIGGFVLCPKWLRNLIYRSMGIKTETNRFGANIRFYSSKVIIGKNSFVNNGCYFHNYSSVSLGDNVFLGPEVMLTTVSHKIGDTTCRATALESAPITIQNGTWVGARAIILPGVTIGQGCIIGAGAVVSKDCEPNGLYAGVPAKKIKDLT